MKVGDAKLLKRLRGENVVLNRLLAEAELYKTMLKWLAEWDFGPGATDRAAVGAFDDEVGM
jgi:hypothetical protein